MSMHVTNIVGQVVGVIVGPVRRRVIDTTALLEGLGVPGKKVVSSTQQITITDAAGNTYLLHLNYQEGVNCLAAGNAVVSPTVADVEGEIQ